MRTTRRRANAFRLTSKIGLVSALFASVITLSPDVPLSPGSRPAEAASSQPVVTITDAGVDQPNVHVAVGVRSFVEWRNDSSSTIEITSDSGVLDSGPVPPGGAFVASFPIPGTHQWTSSIGNGTVVGVPDGFGVLTSDDDLPVAPRLPDLYSPPLRPDEIVDHPDLVMESSTARFLVGLTDDATIGQVDRIAFFTGADIVGVMPDIGLIVYAFQRTPTDHRDVDRAIETAEALPGVALAAHVIGESDASLPPPSDDLFIDSKGVSAYEWTDTASRDFGRQLNMHIEGARVPAAWNLREATEALGTERTTTVVVDAGFEDHVDLDRLDFRQLCGFGIGTIESTKRCTALTPSDHGNHVFGIIGADFDDSIGPGGLGTGTAGIDLYSDLIAVQRNLVGFQTSANPFSLDFTVERTYLMLLEAIERGEMGSVRLINHSSSFKVRGDKWEKRWAAETCGPGADDDGSGTGPCTPDTEDGRILETRRHGELFRRVLVQFNERLTNPPLFLGAAGNDSNDVCADATAAPCVGQDAVKLRAENQSSLAWAARNWDPADGPNPVIVVGSVGDLSFEDQGEPARSLFSNINVDVSAHGNIYSTGSSFHEGELRAAPLCAPTRNEYCFQGGTSQAAPTVAGILGLLLAWDPTLTSNDLRELLLTRSRADVVSDDAGPLVDAYAMLTSLSGVSLAIADMSDPSVDGNRRIVLDINNEVDSVDTIEGPSNAQTAPDGVVDIRDFRRFRDAWLASCDIRSETGCPGEVDLNGADDHPKRDLNDDGCINLDAPLPDPRTTAATEPCPSEVVWSRFDLNGDGVVSATQTARFGTPASVLPGDLPELTDLDVIKMHWGPGSTQGLDAAALDDLLVSGDVEIHLDGLDANGATTADVEVAIVNDAGVAETWWIDSVEIAAPSPVITIPAGTRFEIIAESGSGPALIETQTELLPPLAAGADVRLDVCGSLGIDVDPGSLTSDGDVADVTVTARTCGTPPSGISVDLSVDPMSADGAVLGSTTLVTDGAGIATTTITTGLADDDITITARALIPVDGGSVASRSAAVDVPLRLPYELNVLARSGTAGYPSLGVSSRGIEVFGPTVAADGTVVFADSTPGGDRLVAVDDSSDPAVALNLPAKPGDLTTIVAPPQTADNGDIATVWRGLDGLDVVSALTVSSVTDFVRIDELTRTRATFAGSSTSGVLDFINGASIDNSGNVVFMGTDDDIGADLVSRVDAQGNVVLGTELGAGRVWLADDGAIAADAAGSATAPPGTFSAFEEFILVAGDITQSFGRVAQGGVCAFGAAQCQPHPDGFRSVGRVGISDDGQVIAFLGRENTDGQGVHVALRTGPDPLNWTDPIRLVGGNVVVADRELPGNGSFAGIPGEPLGVLHTPVAPAGPAGDVIVVAFLGTPATTGPNYEETTGLFTVRATVVAGSAGTYRLDVADAEPVLQYGDDFEGAAVRNIDLWDPLATPTGATGPADHHLAFIVTTDDATMVVSTRAPERSRGRPGDPAAAAATSPAATPAAQAPASAAGDEPSGPTTKQRKRSDRSARQAPEQSTPEPIDRTVAYFAAFTVSTRTVAAGTTFTLTNRSRRIDGVAVEAALDRILNLTPFPRLLGPDETITLRPTRLGTARIAVGAPLFDTELGGQATMPIRIVRGANRMPTVVLPPVVAPSGSTLDMVASAFDPDSDQLSYSWDLDGDGNVDRTTDRSNVLRLTVDEVDALVCGGTCSLDQPYPITVVVDDGKGRSARATALFTRTASVDFQIDLAPSLSTISPGRFGRVFVDITPVGGFVGTVDLRLVDIPAGWSANLAATSVAAGESTTVSVGVPAGTPLTQATIGVIGSANGIERRSDLSVTTVFGLVPQCFATIEVTVLDPTGAPLEGAGVFTNSTTDAQGLTSRRFRLPEGATVDQIRLTARHDEHLAPPFRDIRYGCDEVVAVEIQMLPARIATVSGRAVEGRYNPVAASRPVPTDIAVDGAIVTYRGNPVATSDVDGRFDFPVEEIAIGVFPSVSARVALAGYHPFAAAGVIGDNTSVDLGDIPLLPVCSVTVGGGVVIDQNDQPVAGARMYIGRIDTGVSSGADGRFDLDRPMPPGSFNTPRSFQVIANVPATPEWMGGRNGSTFTNRVGCGQSTDDVTVRVQRPIVMVDRLADLSGTVTELGTGLPISGASIRLIDAARGRTLRSGSTGDDGTYQFDDIELGETPSDATSPFLLRVRVLIDHPDHFAETTTTTLTSEAVTTVDDELQRIKTGTLVGTVRDIDTGAPVGGATVTAFGRTTTTGDDGAYEINDIKLGRDDSRTGTVFAAKSIGSTQVYWPARANVMFSEPGELRQDLDVLRVCGGGDISGVVYNAETLEPLDGVRIFVPGGSTTTGTDGAFAFTNIQVSDGNQANSVIVSASKEGFFSASVPIDVFCESSSVVDFGNPSTEIGTIVGTVTDQATGGPVVGAFVGSQFGSSTTTGDDGSYRFDRVPLNPDNSARTWSVTVIDGDRRVTASVPVPATPEAVLDFVLGAENTAPSATPGSVSVIAGQSVPITLSGTDADGDTLTFSITDTPESGTLSGGGANLMFTADQNTPGGTVTTIGFTASDGTATSPIALVTITIEAAPNQPPVVTAPATLSVLSGSTVTYTVLASDPDGGIPSIATVGPPTWIALVDNGDGTGTVTVDATALAAGTTAAVDIQASDGSATASASTTINVVSQPTAPTPIIEVDGQPVDADQAVVGFEGETIMLDATPSLPGSASGLSYAWAIDERPLKSANGAVTRAAPLTRTATGSVLELRPTDDTVYVIVLSVTGTDPTLTASRRIEVVANNVAPGVRLTAASSDGADLPISNIEVVVGRQLNLTFQVGDPGLDTFEVRNAPPGAVETIDGTVVTLAFTPSSAGDVALGFDVCDDDGGCGSWAGSFTAVAPQPVNPTAPAPLPTTPPPDLDGPLPSTGGQFDARPALVLIGLGTLLALAARRRRWST